jgi:hypothetical protein
MEKYMKENGRQINLYLEEELMICRYIKVILKMKK